MVLKFDTEGKKYLFILGNALIAFILAYIFKDESMDVLEGLVALIKHHNLTSTDAFYIGGYSGAFVNAGLSLIVATVFFILTKTKIGSGEFAGLIMVFGYSFFGKNFLNIIPFFVGTYLYQYVVKKPLAAKSPMACFASCMAPMVSTIAYHSNGLTPGSIEALIVACIFGLVGGFAVGWVSNWMPRLLQERSILLGAASSGVVIIVLAGILRSFGMSHELVNDHPSMDQAMYGPILMSLLLFQVYMLVAGLLGGGKFRSTINFQCSKHTCINVIEEHGFADALLNSGILGLVGIIYFMVLPYTTMNGSIYAAVATITSFASKGLSLRYALPFLVGKVGFDFISAGVAGLFAGEAFIHSGLVNISSNPGIIRTYVGSHIAPLNRKIGFAKAVAIGAVFAILVQKVFFVHDQMLLYNSGFTITLVIFLYHVADDNDDVLFG